jgi:hypothetical protein
MDAQPCRSDLIDPTIAVHHARVVALIVILRTMLAYALTEYDFRCFPDGREMRAWIRVVCGRDSVDGLRTMRIGASLK